MSLSNINHSCSEIINNLELLDPCITKDLRILIHVVVSKLFSLFFQVYSFFILVTLRTKNPIFYSILGLVYVSLLRRTQLVNSHTWLVTVSTCVICT
nr:MAG TPA: hypothetical protein [Caudoviricetes sp.]